MQAILFSTLRLVIRRIAAEDERDYLAIFGSEAVCRYDDFPAITPPEAADDIARILRAYVECGPEQEYAVVLPEEGKVIGVLVVRADRGSRYIGYHFNEAYHGCGYAREAAQGLALWLESRSAEPIRALVHSDNTRSIHLLERLSFALETESEKERCYLRQGAPFGSTAPACAGRPSGVAGAEHGQQG